MAQTNVNIRMDENTKKAFDAFCSEIGLSVSSVFNMFAKTVVREQRIPFEISAETPNKETREAIAEVQRMKTDSSIGKTYDDVDVMFEELLA